MSRAERLGGGVVAFAALVGLGAWLLGRQDDDAGREAPRAATTSAAVAEAMLPEATAPKTDDAPDAPAPESIAVVDTSAAAPAAQHRDAFSFSGRVVDESGRAVAGAMVRHLPTAWQRTKLDLRFDALAPPLDLARLTATQTTSDGRFSLSVTDHVPDHAASPGRAGGEHAWAGSFGDVPQLLVMYPAFETHVVRCLDWRGGDFASGDIVLVPGVTVTGRAVDENTLPLAGVNVALPGFGGDPNDPRDGEWQFVRRTFRAVTGDDGRFALEGFWAGPRMLELRAPSRSLVQRMVVGERGLPLDLGDITLPRGALIQGAVVDAQDRPVPGASLLARSAGLLAQIEPGAGDVAAQFLVRVGGDGASNSVSDVETTADEHGAFRFDTLEPARAPFRIYAGAEGFEPVRSDEVALDAPPLRLTLPTVASLVLTVVEAGSHAPVTGASVAAHRASAVHDAGERPLQVVSESSELLAAGVAEPHAGVFLLSPAGAAKNSAVVTAGGHAKQRFELPGVPPGERRTVTVELPLALHLTGRIVNGQHEPIAAATVVLREPQKEQTSFRFPPEDPPEAARATAGADGRFEFGALFAGDWIVHASASGFVAITTAPMPLKPGAALEDLELVLQPAGAIAGVVLAAGEPVAHTRLRAVTVAQADAVRAAEQAHGGSIALSDRPPLDERYVTTGKDGRFLLEDLPPEAFELTGARGVLAVAEVKAGETTEVTLLQRVPPRVRGHVTDAQGPVAGAEIRWSRLFAPLKGWDSTGEVDAYSDANGDFDLQVDRPGHYKINAETGKAYSPLLELDLDWEQVHWAEFKLKDRG